MSKKKVPFVVRCLDTEQIGRLLDKIDNFRNSGDDDMMIDDDSIDVTFYSDGKIVISGQFSATNSVEADI